MAAGEAPVPSYYYYTLCGHTLTHKLQKKTVKAAAKFNLDCSGPVNDAIFDLAAFEKFLHDKIKVQGRTNNLSNSVSIAKGSTPGHLTISVSAGVPFPKRYLKYLTKKFLKKHQLRDWLRVIATSKGSYELKYFNVAGPEAEEEEDDE